MRLREPGRTQLNRSCKTTTQKSSINKLTLDQQLARFSWKTGLLTPVHPTLPAVLERITCAQKTK